ncbi:hypothetical protein LOY39_12480 [Pseudomonas rhodesiae]|uniref:hypothetical protein n=1 Tax=Pseudomonas rhodesiae TaxID=76760 RepID=UPI00215E2BD2|nr:hypothetical protein [Pseudomonas rhodesiae]UVL11450.1 hypothetical protein LOY39_12480 [Pseudomonas rhodesiae]
MDQALNQRLLVPDDKIVVVLDTAPARELAYVDEIPAWVNIFAEMYQHGYSFSLADGTFAELLNQRRKDAISGDQLLKIIQRLALFLAPNLPVLLGKRDLRGMLQLERLDWDESECQALSQAAWGELRRRVDAVDAQGSPEAILQKERDDWIDNFIRWRTQIAGMIARETALSTTAEAVEPEPFDLNSKTQIVLQAMERVQVSQDLITPPMSVRNHLQNRYIWRQIVRSLKPECPYDPLARKKRNDGIDADLYRFLILPALVVTRDKAFLGGLADIDSFQTGWFFSPEDLAGEWLGGTKPAPAWPGCL